MDRPACAGECGRKLRRDSRGDLCFYCNRKINGRPWGDKERAQKRAYYAANREKVLAQVYAYAERNPEKVRQSRLNQTLNYLTKKRDQHVENVDRRIVWERDSGICHICNTEAYPATWHLDHVVPIARGGEHSYANTAVSHPRCNIGKGAKLMSELREKGTK